MLLGMCVCECLCIAALLHKEYIMCKKNRALYKYNIRLKHASRKSSLTVDVPFLKPKKIEILSRKSQQTKEACIEK